MQQASGSLSVYLQGSCFTLFFPRRSWMAAELVGFLDEVCEAPNPRLALLKLLGITVQITRERPLRSPKRHWVEVDLQRRLLETNSPLIRRAIDRRPPEEDAPYGTLALQRIHDFLDRYEFTVKLHN